MAKHKKESIKYKKIINDAYGDVSLPEPLMLRPKYLHPQFRLPSRYHVGVELFNS